MTALGRPIAGEPVTLYDGYTATVTQYLGTVEQGMTFVVLVAHPVFGQKRVTVKTTQRAFIWEEVE